MKTTTKNPKENTEWTECNKCREVIAVVDANYGDRKYRVLCDKCNEELHGKDDE
jgi:hypothetical protein